MASTTITLKRETQQILESLGRKGESYDTIINKLIHKYIGGEQDET